MRNLLISPSTLDSSSCMTKYLYEKIVLAAPVNKPAYMDKGELLHFMIASYYKSKMEGKLNEEQRIEKAIDDGRHKVISLDLEIEVAEDEVIHTFRDYCSFWKGDSYFPVAVEQEVVETLYEEPDEEGREGLRIILQMIVDVIFETPQGQRIWTDHKTRSRNRETIPLANQFMAYALISGNNRSMRNNIGFQKTVAPEKKFTRDPFFYSKEVLEWWRDWTIYRAQYIDSCIKANHFPPDFTVCNQYDGCWYKDVCMQSPSNRENFLRVNFVQRKRKASIYEMKR